MTQDERPRVNRRTLLKGASAAAAGVGAALGAPAAAAAVRGRPAWDRVVDIVCVGSGAAAMTAAVTAVGLGHQVLVLEKSPVLGGTTAKSGGVLWIPNHPLLRKKGVQDARDDCLRYMARHVSPQTYSAAVPMLGLDAAQYRLLEAFYDNGSAMLERMQALGALQFEEFQIGRPGFAPPDYGAHLAENKVPRGRSLVPVMPARGTGADLLLSQQATGRGFITQLESWLTAKGAPLLTDQRVVRVIQDHGRVVGVEAHRPGAARWCSKTRWRAGRWAWACSFRPAIRCCSSTNTAGAW
jgi:glycine/D-amino acid oxidase-like deaminating enzyme